MKKSAWWVGFWFLVACPLPALAEPLTFEPAANVTGAAGFELDVNASFSSVNSSSNLFPELALRAGFPWLEAQVRQPFRISSVSTRNGPQDLGLMLKSAFLSLPGFAMAAGLDLGLPTGDETQGLGEGFDLEPFLAADLDAGWIKVTANLGYRYRAEYSLGSIESVSVDPYGNFLGVSLQELREKPGDRLRFALDCEVRVGDALALETEAWVSRYEDFSFMGQVVEDSGETFFTLVPGLRIRVGALKAKLGVELPIGEKGPRHTYLPLYDWRLVAGVGLAFGL